MKKETLEKAAKEFYPPSTTDLICSPKLVRDAFIAGAKWQAERMYSEEDLRESFHVGRLYQGRESDTTFEGWFEQFKKK